MCVAFILTIIYKHFRLCVTFICVLVDILHVMHILEERVKEMCVSHHCNLSATSWDSCVVDCFVGCILILCSAVISNFSFPPLPPPQSCWVLRFMFYVQLFPYLNASYYIYIGLSFVFVRGRKTPNNCNPGLIHRIIKSRSKVI